MALLPGLRIEFRRSKTAPNPQDLHGYAHVVGLASAGPIGVPTTINNFADLAQFGFGEGVEQVAEILAEAGGPVYFTRTVTTTQGTVGAVQKLFALSSVGIPVSIGAADAGVTYTANQDGVTVEQADPGKDTASTTVQVTKKAIKVTLKRQMGVITATAEEVRQAVAGTPAAMALLAAVANTGKGTGTAAVQGATALPFGSSGTMSVSGTPTDAFTQLICKVLRSGTVGGTPTPTLAWSADNGAAFSGEQLIPATGIVPLKDSYLDTGLTVTFTGQLATDDEFIFTVTGPSVGSTDLLSACQTAIDDDLRQWGFLTSPTIVDRALATAIDTKLQMALQDHFLQGIFNVRQIGAGVAGETEDQWMDAIALSFLGFQSKYGLLQLCAGYTTHISAYTLRQFNRPLVFAASARKSAIPVHEDLARVASGALSRILGIDHNEAKKRGLQNARFITARTFKNRPGEFYITSSPTMSDPTDTSYTLAEYVALILSVGRIARDTAWVYIQETFQVNSKGDPQNGIATGSLWPPTAKDIENYVSAPILAFLFKAKTDGKVSASPYPDGEGPVKVPLDYNYAQTRELRMEIQAVPRAPAEQVIIGLSLAIPF